MSIKKKKEIFTKKNLYNRNIFSIFVLAIARDLMVNLRLINLACVFKSAIATILYHPIRDMFVQEISGCRDGSNYLETTDISMV